MSSHHQAGNAQSGRRAEARFDLFGEFKFSATSEPVPQFPRRVIVGDVNACPVVPVQVPELDPVAAVRPLVIKEADLLRRAAAGQLMTPIPLVLIVESLGFDVVEAQPILAESPEFWVAIVAVIVVVKEGLQVFKP